MELSGEQFKQLQDALASAFPTLSDLRMFVTTEFWESRADVPMGDSPKMAAFHLIEWAIAQGRLEELVKKAHHVRPQNPGLLNFVAALLQEARIQTYLQAFLTEIEGRLNQMLLLSSRETPAAVETSARILRYITLPPSLPGRDTTPRDDTRKRTFDTFAAAFQALGKRVLLLGAPGAGKTTTLLQFACMAATERLHSSKKPLPIFISVHRWDPQIPLSNWTQTILKESLPEVRLEGLSTLSVRWAG